MRSLTMLLFAVCSTSHKNPSSPRTASAKDVSHVWWRFHLLQRTSTCHQRRSLSEMQTLTSRPSSMLSHSRWMSSSLSPDLNLTLASHSQMGVHTLTRAQHCTISQAWWEPTCFLDLACKDPEHARKSPASRPNPSATSQKHASPLLRNQSHETPRPALINEHVPSRKLNDSFLTRNSVEAMRFPLIPSQL